MEMADKTLKKMEVFRGFIQIPANALCELVGNTRLPRSTTLNGYPAKLDKYGRLWSSYLKNRFSVGTEIVINKSEEGYRISPSDIQKANLTSEMKHQDDMKPIDIDSESKLDVFYRVLQGDCVQHLKDGSISDIHLTFLDPPYRQGKDYRFFDDNQPVWKYWSWLKEILSKVYEVTVDGGAIYFMQREKNAEQVLRVLRKTGWKFQNLIVWRKKTSAVPVNSGFSKHYQIIAYATKGEKPRVFNRLRVDLPPLPEHKYEHENGVYLTDVWDDVRELTSGYFAGNEAIRDTQGKRVHVQQSPIALLLRIVLSSTLPGDTVFDPLAGTGTTLVVAYQLRRNSVGIEIDPNYVELIKKRLSLLRPSDNISQYCDYYRFTPNLRKIWPLKGVVTEQRSLF